MKTFYEVPVGKKFVWIFGSLSGHIFTKLDEEHYFSTDGTTYNCPHIYAIVVQIRED